MQLAPMALQAGTDCWLRALPKTLCTQLASVVPAEADTRMRLLLLREASICLCWAGATC